MLAEGQINASGGITVELAQALGGGVGLGIVDILETHRSRPNAPRRITMAVMMASTRRATRRVSQPLRRC